MKSSVPWFWQRAYPPPRCNCITNQYSCHIKGLTQTYFCNTTQNTTSLYISVFEQLIDKIQSISNFNSGVQVYCFVGGKQPWMINLPLFSAIFLYMIICKCIVIFTHQCEMCYVLCNYAETWEHSCCYGLPKLKNTIFL